MGLSITCLSKMCFGYHLKFAFVRDESGPVKCLLSPNHDFVFKTSPVRPSSVPKQMIWFFFNMLSGVISLFEILLCFI